MTLRNFSMAVLFSLINFTCSSLNAQVPTVEDARSGAVWKPTTSLYIELLGKSFYSINVDFRKSEKRAISFGAQLAEGSFWPSFMYYHFFGELYRLEIGGGASGIITMQDGLAGMGLHGVIGYRYQKKDGLLFRIGFTPLIGIPLTNAGRFAVVPWIGMSIGYSF